jgi:hypothetical protein
MKLTRSIFFALFVGVLVLGFGITSVNSTESPGENDVHVEKSRVFTISDWLNSLDMERQAQVLGIFERNLICFKKGDEKSKPKPEGQVLKEVMHMELQAILTPGQFKVFESIVFGNKEGTPFVSTTFEVCEECQDARSDLHWAKWYLYSALNNYDISYCDYYPIHIDYVPIYLGLAKFYTEEAYDQIDDAYNNCVCPEEETLWENINFARTYADTAADYTDEYCAPNSPWISQLGTAITRLAYAKYFSIDDCLDQVCN